MCARPRAIELFHFPDIYLVLGPSLARLVRLSLRDSYPAAAIVNGASVCKI